MASFVSREKERLNPRGFKGTTESKTPCLLTMAAILWGHPQHILDDQSLDYCYRRRSSLLLTKAFVLLVKAEASKPKKIINLKLSSPKKKSS